MHKTRYQWEECNTFWRPHSMLIPKTADILLSHQHPDSMTKSDRSQCSVQKEIRTITTWNIKPYQAWQCYVLMVNSMTCCHRVSAVFPPTRGDEGLSKRWFTGKPITQTPLVFKVIYAIRTTKQLSQWNWDNVHWGAFQQNNDIITKSEEHFNKTVTSWQN